MLYNHIGLVFVVEVPKEGAQFGTQEDTSAYALQMDDVVCSIVESLIENRRDTQ